MSHYGFAGSKTTADNFAERASYYEKKLGEMRALKEQRVAIGKDVSALIEEIAQADVLVARALGDLESGAGSGREDYYFKLGADTLDSQISGPLAERLGLGETTRSGDYLALYRGINPRTGELFLERNRAAAIEKDIVKAELKKFAACTAKLNDVYGSDSIRVTLAEANEAGGSEQVLGHSSCVSLQKSLSMYWATAPEHERVIIQEALLEAVKDAGNYEQVRGYIGGRLGAGGSEFVAGEGLVLEYLHCTSRIEKGHAKPDPQLHVHRERPNSVRLPGGAMRTLDAAELYKRQKEFGAVVDVALASKLLKRLPHLAACFEVDHAGHGLKLNESTVSRDRVMSSSKRRKGIQAKSAELGIDGAKGKEAIAVRSRSSKPEAIDEGIFDYWRAEIGEIRLAQSTLAELAMPTVLQTQEMLFKGNSVIADHHLDFVAAQLTIGKGDIVDIDLVRDALIKQLGIVEIPPRLDENGELVRDGKKYTTAEMVRIEADCLKAAVGGMENNRWAIEPSLVEHIIQCYETERQSAQKPGDRPFLLSDEQREAAFRLTSNGQYNFLQGAAGVGKSATLAPVFRAFGEAFSQKGHRCIGVAPQNKQASELQKSTGIKSRTVHSLLMSHEKAMEAKAKGARYDQNALVHPGDVIVCDEAGTLDTFTLHALIKVCHDSQAKLVMVGDRRQMESVGTASMFGLLCDAMGDNLARIESIARQKEAFKPIAQALYEGKIAWALKAMESKDQIRIFREEVNEATELVKAAFEDAQSARNGWQDVLILADTNAQVAILNDKFREKMLANGFLDAAKQIEIESVDLQGYSHTIGVAPGDRVLLRKNASDAEKLPISNGDLGTVLLVRENIQSIGGEDVIDIELVVRRDDGETVHIRNSEYQAIQHGYAMTVTKCQGMTVDRSYYLPSDMTRMRALYVAYTRGREGGFIYSNELRWADIKKGFEQFSEKETALSLMPAMRKAIEAAEQTCQPLTLTAQAVTVQERLNKAGERFQMPGQEVEPASPTCKIVVIPNTADEIALGKAYGKTIVSEVQLTDPKFRLPTDTSTVAVALNPLPPIPAEQDTSRHKPQVIHLPPIKNRAPAADILDRLEKEMPPVIRRKYVSMQQPQEASHEKAKRFGSLTRSERMEQRTERSDAAGSGSQQVAGSLGIFERDTGQPFAEARFKVIANIRRPVGLTPPDGMRWLSERSLASNSGGRRAGLLPGDALADRQSAAGVRWTFHSDALSGEQSVLENPRKYPVDKIGAQRETDEMKRNVDLISYAQHLGYVVDKKESYKGHTVLRGNGDAKIDVYAAKDGTWGWTDRHSRKGGDIFKLKQFADGGDFKSAKDSVRGYLAAPSLTDQSKRGTPWVEQVQERALRIAEGTASARRILALIGRSDTAYLQRRGISQEVLSETRWKTNRHGSAVFPHVNAEHKVCGYEFRGRNVKGFSKDCEKGLYIANPSCEKPTEICFCEGGVDTLSAYQLTKPEQRQTVLFVGTAGETGPGTEKAITALAQRSNIQKFSTLYNQDAGGDNLTAKRHKRLAQQFPDGQFTDLRDVVGLRNGEDMNDLLRRLQRQAHENERQRTDQDSPEPAHAKQKTDPQPPEGRGGQWAPEPASQDESDQDQDQEQEEWTYSPGRPM